jgi:hypothetical protein
MACHVRVLANAAVRPIVAREGGIVVQTWRQADGIAAVISLEVRTQGLTEFCGVGTPVLLD